jgi:gliding motility-associated-like protein
MSDTSSLTPIVYPKDTTIYTLTVSDKGCVDSASVKVNVLQFITVKFGLDTGICKTDTIALKPISDALSYRWRENNNANSLNDYFTKYPKATPLSTTKYFVTANLGYCQDSTSFTVHVSPYPIAQVSNDTAICLGSRLPLFANFTGAFYQWNNTATLLNANTLSPIAGPSKTTSYIFTALDTLYCPKKVSDTITVRVVQPVKIFAGKDTSVSLGQPLQLLAQGADNSFSYLWTPNNYLDNDAISNPIATITANSVNPIRFIVKAISPEGCINIDDINVKIYDGGTDILVPSAFTPNADGKNDLLKPLLIGITKLDYFEIFNRWGQLIYSTNQINAGWDGRLKNTNQPSGTYVYTVQGQDFLGKVVYKKGTVVLIR